MAKIDPVEPDVVYEGWWSEFGMTTNPVRVAEVMQQRFGLD